MSFFTFNQKKPMLRKTNVHEHINACVRENCIYAMKMCAKLEVCLQRSEWLFSAFVVVACLRTRWTSKAIIYKPREICISSACMSGFTQKRMTTKKKVRSQTAASHWHWVTIEFGNSGVKSSARTNANNHNDNSVRIYINIILRVCGRAAVQSRCVSSVLTNWM